MLKLTYSTVGILILALSSASGAMAASITGFYTYSITGQTSQPSCNTIYGGNPWTDNFASQTGGNSIAADPVTFSICDGTPGFLDGGQFSIISGPNALMGTFSGVLEGASGSGPGGGDVFEGTVTFTTSTGYYSGLSGDMGIFEVITGAVNTPAFPTGSIQFQSIPEPSTVVFGASGILLLALSRKFLKRA